MISLAKVPEKLHVPWGEDGKTLLTAAATGGNAAAVRFLVQSGCIDVNERDKNDDTPLTLACGRDYNEGSGQGAEYRVHSCPACR